MKMFGTGYQQEEMLHDMKMNILFDQNSIIVMSIVQVYPFEVNKKITWKYNGFNHFI